CLLFLHEMANGLIDRVERRLGFGAGKLADVRPKLELSAFVAPELFVSLEQREARLRAGAFLLDRLSVRDELFVDPRKARLIVPFDAIEDVPGRRLAPSFQRGEPRLVPAALLDQRRYAVQRVIGFRHRMSSNSGWRVK